MSRIISVPLRDGNSILVEVHEPIGVRRAGIQDNVEKVSQTLDELLETLRPLVSSTAEKLKNLENEFSPDEMSMEFGIGFKIDTSGMLSVFVSTGANADIKIGFVWNRQNNLKK